ncbi:putative SOS response-associated peptidase YedK [Subtercola boreus]|nr:putative SOS response-associated peptidase YedK [Subtercola boreus]
MNKETDDLILEFIARGGRAEDWRPSYSVAPTDEAPIIRDRVPKDETGQPGETVERELELAAWGLKPAWSKPGGPAPINARLESVATNGMFRGAFASHRCIVPMTGYYEWQQQDDGKQPYFIHSDAEVLAAAGLYSARKVDDAWNVTFTIITREARDASGEVHDRMPVFLQPDLWTQWLDPAKVTAPDALLHLLELSSASVARSITTYPVARTVNNSRTLDAADPALIEPIELAG